MTIWDMTVWAPWSTADRSIDPTPASLVRLGDLGRPARLVGADTPVSAVDLMFNEDASLRAVVLTDGSGALTLVDRLWFGYLMSGPLGFGRVLHTRSRMGDLELPGSVVLGFDTGIDEAALEVLTRGHGTSTLDGLVAVGPGGLVRVVQVRAVFEGLSRSFAHQSMHDPLTGLPNRLHLMHRQRSLGPGELRALLYVDLDRFKDVNDRHGHDAGDEVLVEFAARLRESCRHEDAVVRLGGDEFAVLVGDGLSDIQLRHLAERLVLLAADPFTVRDQGGGERSVSIGASVGTATTESLEAHEHVSSIEVLLKKADLAMYRAKAQGRGRVQAFELDRAAVESEAQARYARNGLERSLRAAIDNGAIQVHHQPIVDLADGRVVHLEALARWSDPAHGTVPPDVFVPLAEQGGMIGDLGRLVLRTACRDAVAWTTPSTSGDEPGPQVDEGRTSPGVAVNVSALQLDDGFVGAVAAVLDQSGLAADRLVLEITESTQLVNVPDSVRVLSRLRSMGIRIALDDFGTGKSSLELLRTLPLDIVKIDRGFVQAMSRSGADRVLLRLIIDAAHALGLTVCAEGVEEAEQLAALRRMGVDTAQGWLLGRPSPAAGLDLTSRDTTRECTTTDADLDGAHDGSFTVLTGSDCVVQYVSTAVADVLGLPATQLVGTPVTDWLHPDDVSVALGWVPQVDGHGERVVRVRHASGAPRWLRVRSEARPDDSGARAVLSRCRDVTSLVQAELRTSQLESTFMRVFDDAPTGMALSDLDGQLLRVNDAFADMVGVSAGSLRGCTVRSITHPGDQHRDSEELRAQAGGVSGGTSREKRYRYRDGTYVRARVTTSVVPDESGQPRQIVAHIVPR